MVMEIYELDDIDYQIMHLLRKDARTTIQELSNSIGVRRSTIYSHLTKLAENEVIAGYSLVPNFKKIGARITAFVLVGHHDSGEYEGYRHFSNLFSKIPNVLEVYVVTGEFDYLLKVRVADILDLGDAIINPLKRIKGVSRIQTMTVFHSEMEELGNNKINFEIFQNKQ